MPVYTPMTQEELSQSLLDLANTFWFRRPDLRWFSNAALLIGLRGAEIVNMPKLYIDEDDTRYFIYTYKGSSPRWIPKDIIMEPLKTAMEEKNFNWTLWSQKSIAQLIGSTLPEYQIWYYNSLEDRLTSQLLSHFGRIRYINFMQLSGRSLAFMAAEIGVSESTITHYLSMKFVNTGTAG